MAPLSIKDPGSHWTSEIRDEKLQTLLDRKQDDAENAKLLIDLLENGVFRADASADSDSDDDDDDGVEGDIDGLSRAALDDDDMEVEDDDSMLAIPISARRPLRSAGPILAEYSSRDNHQVQAVGPGFEIEDDDEDFVPGREHKISATGPGFSHFKRRQHVDDVENEDNDSDTAPAAPAGRQTRHHSWPLDDQDEDQDEDQVFLRYRRAAPARPLAVSEFEERHHGVSVYGPPTSQQGPSTVYEVVQVVEGPRLRAERMADDPMEPVRRSYEREVDIPVPSLEEEEREVRELERQLEERKARMEWIRMERERERMEEIRMVGTQAGSASKGDHDAGAVQAVAVQSAYRRGWFSRVKSRFGRLFSRSGPGDKKKDRERDLPDSSKPTGEELVGQHDLISPIINNLVVVNNNIAPPNGMQEISSPPPAAKPALPPPKISASEALLRTKIFAPHTLALTTILPEPAWTNSLASSIATTLFSPTATPLTRHTLLPQGQFIAQRQRDVTDALSKIELGLGVTGPGGIGVNGTSTGILGLLKPYQWINMWRGTKRDMYVASTTLEKDSKGEEVDMDALHALENELISPAKYHFGESEFVTVVTHSSDVNSGAVALFRAALVDGLATRLTLEARFKDVPREICKILRKGVKPNRYELTRAGSALKCSKGGGEGVLPPCLAVVERDGEKGWEGVGGGWRRALRIVLGEGEGTGPREGLVATVPQMLAFLHLTQRVVDYVPSTPVFSFEPPLVGVADDGPCRVRRGTKLLGQPGGAVHVGEEVTISVLFSRESRWVREQLLWA